MTRTTFTGALLFALAAFAAVSFIMEGKTRRTFVFYERENAGSGSASRVNASRAIVEERQLSRTGTTEERVTSYIEEVLLGPSSLETLPLFPPRTRLLSCLYRDGEVFANLSENAALPVSGTYLSVAEELSILEEGIRRNFPAVRRVALFINGVEVAAP